MPWTIDGKKVESSSLQFKTKAEILAIIGSYIGETYYASDIGEDPCGAIAVWDGTQWVGFLRSNYLNDL